MRIGLFGGSFDPPHQAHRALARTALTQLALDELRWLPAGRPWQKERGLAPAEDRRAMVAAMIGGEPRFVVDDRELARAGPSYTIDTVRELQAERPGATLCLLIGQDQYAAFPTWREWEALADAVTLAVAARAGAAVAAPAPLTARAHRMVRLDLPPMDVSATVIRAHLAGGGAAADLVPAMVPAEVARYIDSHRLYRPPVTPTRS
ncbi:MAG TPA: nicotinate (nicotinamide) nucleotide adenylyltransferase [Methylibium sp.]|nr:nicotinate (nicotinamide) nucleotide adenylyltransferase [Methylibium sp.]